jgi:hypothetical protein
MLTFKVRENRLLSFDRRCDKDFVDIFKLLQREKWKETFFFVLYPGSDQIKSRPAVNRIPCDPELISPVANL